MKTYGNPNQWGPTNWPPEELIHNDSDTYGVVHRVAGDGSEKGIGAFCDEVFYCFSGDNLLIILYAFNFGGLFCYNKTRSPIMPKKIVVVNASPRKGWNTDTLLMEAAKGSLRWERGLFNNPY